MDGIANGPGHVELLVKNLIYGKLNLAATDTYLRIATHWTQCEQARAHGLLIAGTFESDVDANSRRNFVDGFEEILFDNVDGRKCAELTGSLQTELVSLGARHNGLNSSRDQ